MTKVQMLAAAEARGHGARALEATFVNFQKRGLLGKSEAKEARRGGAGLWHPIQRELFCDLLDLRERGLSLRLLANLPVAGWTHGAQGVTFDQARRAYMFWLQPNVLKFHATDRRSADARARDRQIAWLAAPRAKSHLKRELGKVLEMAHDQLSGTGPTVSRETMMASVLNVLTDDSGRARVTGNAPERFAAKAFDDSFRWTALVLAYADLLNTDLEGVADLWEWVRNTLRVMPERYAMAQPELAQLPVVGRLYAPFSPGTIIWGACTTLTIALGGSLEASLKGKTIQGLGKPPSIAKTT